jgi:phage shock protein PspC (stress-responsive transcriptional regulator)
MKETVAKHVPRHNPTCQLFTARSRSHRAILAACSTFISTFAASRTGRASLVLLTLFHGAGILLYIILSIIIPKETGEAVLNKEIIEKVGETAEKTGKHAQKLVKKVKSKAHWPRDDSCGIHCRFR